MRFYIWFQTDKYSEMSVIIKEDLAGVLDFLNSHTDNEQFKFNVVEGKEVKFKAVEIVKKYIKE